VRSRLRGLACSRESARQTSAPKVKVSRKAFVSVVCVLLVVLAVYGLVDGKDKNDEGKSVQDLLALLATPDSASTIANVVVVPVGNDAARYVVRYQNGSEAMVVLGPYSGGDNAISQALTVQGVRWTVEAETGRSMWQKLLISVLPLLLLVFVAYLFLRKGRIGAGGLMGFGESTAKLLTADQAKITFKDVAGIEEAKEELEEIVDFLKNPPRFTRLGGRIPKGVLLMGSPGTGKTLLARAIAGEAKVPFYSTAGSDFVEMFVGVGASRVRDLFEQGKKNAPCIIFIDEIDAVGRHRGAGVGGGNDEREQTLNQLLVEMDGFEGNDGVILIGATNRPDVLDPALLRPGRFDRRIHASRPDIKGRLEILKIHTRRVPMARNVDLSTIAKATPGFSGADLENLTNESALLAAKQDKEEVAMVDFEDAKDKVLMGSARVSMFISERERRNTAMHEAGHALVAFLIGGEQVDPLHKVTIIPRGDALGLTQQLPREDRLNIDREFLLNRMCILMGGRVAEELMFRQRSSGSANDIEEVTQLARKMVTDWGMSEKMGPVSYSDGEHGVFLGLEMTQATNHCSQESARAIDSEVGRFVNEQCTRARKILTEHLATLQVLAEALLARETLTGAEVQSLVEARGHRLVAAP
jgi:cell division protease FtsH